MPGGLNNVTISSTSYTPAATFQLGLAASRVNLICKQAEVYYQLQQPGSPGQQPSTWAWGEEVFLPRMSQGLDRVCSGIRFRLATAGTSSLITATLMLPWEVG